MGLLDTISSQEKKIKKSSNPYRSHNGTYGDININNFHKSLVYHDKEDFF